MREKGALNEAARRRLPRLSSMGNDRPIWGMIDRDKRREPQTAYCSHIAHDLTRIGSQSAVPTPRSGPSTDGRPAILPTLPMVVLIETPLISHRLRLAIEMHSRCTSTGGQQLPEAHTGCLSTLPPASGEVAGSGSSLEGSA